jgi:hypothetical protein
MVTPHDFVINECTCGRVARDYEDLAVIMEEDGMHYKGSGSVQKGGKSKVVCLRPGCYGAWKTHKLYMKKLQRMLNIQYFRLKQKQDEEEM